MVLFAKRKKHTRELNPHGFPPAVISTGIRLCGEDRNTQIRGRKISISDLDSKVIQRKYIT